MKTKSFLAALLAVVSMGNAQAQSEVEGSLEADFVSSYVWRGLNLGHVSLQPELSLTGGQTPCELDGRPRGDYVKQ